MENLTHTQITNDINKSYEADKLSEAEAAEMFFGPTSRGLIAVEEMKRIRRN